MYARSLVQAIVEEMTRYADYDGIFFPKQSQFERRCREGVVLYKKQKKNIHLIQYKKVNFNRCIASKRIFTHTKK